MQAPVRYTAAVEETQEDERETIAKLDEQFRTIQETTADHYKHGVRAVHAKARAIALGTLTVQDGLPAELAKGLFARGGRCDAIVRISTQPGDILDDSVNSPRGIAIKVFGVEGERLPGSEGDTTHDFIGVNGPTFGNKTTATFLANLSLLAKTTDKVEWLKKAQSAILHPIEAGLEAVGLGSSNLQQMGAAAPVHPLGETYFSQTAYRHGDYIAKWALLPVSKGLTELTGTAVHTSGRPDAIREATNEALLEHGGTWELRIQLARDLEKQPVEDATVEWKQDDVPLVTVATLEVAPQIGWVPLDSTKTEDALAFNIWHGLAAHQPLGNINRARNETYSQSADRCGSVNGCPLHEQRTLTEVA